VTCFQPKFVFEENDGAELRSVVFDVETVGLALDNGMTTTHTNVVDPHLTLVASAQLEFSLVIGYSQQMDIS